MHNYKGHLQRGNASLFLIGTADFAKAFEWQTKLIETLYIIVCIQGKWFHCIRNCWICDGHCCFALEILLWALSHLLSQQKNENETLRRKRLASKSWARTGKCQKIQLKAKSPYSSGLVQKSHFSRSKSLMVKLYTMGGQNPPAHPPYCLQTCQIYSICYGALLLGACLPQVLSATFHPWLWVGGWCFIGVTTVPLQGGNG